MTNTQTPPPKHYAGRGGRDRKQQKLQGLYTMLWLFGITDAGVMARIWKCTRNSAQVSIRRYEKAGLLAPVPGNNLPFMYYVLTPLGAEQAAVVVPSYAAGVKPCTKPSRSTRSPAHDLLTAHLGLHLLQDLRENYLDEGDTVTLHTHRTLQAQGFKVGGYGIPDVLVGVEGAGGTHYIAGELQQSDETENRIKRRLSLYASEYALDNRRIDALVVASTRPTVLHAYREAAGFEPYQWKQGPDHAWRETDDIVRVDWCAWGEALSYHNMGADLHNRYYIHPINSGELQGV